MRRTIATASLGGLLEQKLPAAARAGFDGVDLCRRDLLGSLLSPAGISDRAAALGLRIETYQPFQDGPPVPAEFTSRAAHALDVMAELGSPTMLIACEVSVEGLVGLAELAAGSDVGIAYAGSASGEPAWKAVAEAGHPGLGVCLDAVHMSSWGLDPAGIEEMGEKIFAVRIADASPPRLARSLPGLGALDLRRFLDGVASTGYRGAVSVDVSPPGHADAERTATACMRALLTVEETPSAGPSSTTFVEIAADALAGPAVENLLRRSGFVRVAEHRGEPVGVWRQGEARVLLRRTGGAGGGVLGISAIGLTATDPEGSATRARRLLAVPGRTGPFAVSAPDGVEVVFSRAGEDPERAEGFVPLPPVAPDGSSALTHIDHVALSPPGHGLDEAVSFHQTVAGLRPDPVGATGFRALSSGAARLVFTTPEPGGLLPETAGLQHIAFGCDDIFTAAVAMRIRELPMPAIPDNYYLDLAARFDLDDAVVDAMRAFGVLCDRDEHGEFFHFYTAVLGRRLFFEMVQRVSGYDGYGTPNDGVRAAAQHRRMAMVDLSW